MFNISKYTNWYNKIIDCARNETRVKSKDNYYERHHIIPKSLGGNNDIQNLVLLTAREHYVCHLLLVKMVVGTDKSKMFYAFRRMSNATPFQQRYPARLYETMKSSLSKRVRGIPWSEESKQKVRGVPKTESTKMKMRENNRNRGVPLTEQRKKIISDANKHHHSIGHLKPPGSFPGELNGMYGRKRTSQETANITKANQRMFEIMSPNGLIQVVNMKQFCHDNNLDPSAMWQTLRGYRGRKSHKGYRLLSAGKK